MHITYQLHISLKKVQLITVGKLGTFEFKSGKYIYTGSARKNIHARVKRHLKSTKRLRWHIDYLLANPYSEIINVIYFDQSECMVNQHVSGQITVKGFGASDCKRGCISHLKFIDVLF